MDYTETKAERRNLHALIDGLRAQNPTDYLIIKTLADTYNSSSLFSVIAETERYMYGNRYLHGLLTEVFPELVTDEELNGCDAVDRLSQLYEESK